MDALQTAVPEVPLLENRCPDLDPFCTPFQCTRQTPCSVVFYVKKCLKPPVSCTSTLKTPILRDGAPCPDKVVP
eukprot:3273225-Amphidinium_carterae.1